MEGFVNNIDIYVFMRKCDSLLNYEELYDAFMSRFTLDLVERQQLSEFCRKFCYNLHNRWVKSSHNANKFQLKNSDWLEASIQWPECIKPQLDSLTEKDGESSVQQTEMRTTQDRLSAPSTSSTSVLSVACSKLKLLPRKSFESLGEKQKRRRTEDICTEFTTQELAFALKMRLKEDGKKDVADVLDHLLQNPEDIDKVKALIQKKENNIAVTAEKALGMLVSLKLTRWQYITLRELAKEERLDFYPSYYKIQQTKLECYPQKEHITVTDTEARIKLQALLDHTVKRILKVVNMELSGCELILTSKWGFDGASGQSTYKQNFSEGEGDDACIFMATLVPIRLVCGEEIIWDNEAPSSPFYCRPIFFKFTKETNITVQKEMDSIQCEILELTSSNFDGAIIQHDLLMTMIDGKITSYLSGTCNQSCDICKAKPSEMNDLDIIKSKPMSRDIYKFGLSSLHAWIRCMECLLHISYRLEFRKWSAKDDNKEKLAQRKQHIQDVFRKETGLLIDMVKHGSGTTNDGNTARRFFQNPDKTASITGLDKNLINRFAVILTAISSGERINIEYFRTYAHETLELFISLYDWYYMPASVHKLLYHGADIIKYFNMIPIGKLSEEASEARNKDFRKYREHHSRKCDRSSTNKDILNNFLISSDPYISSLRPKFKRNKKTLSKEVRDFIIIEEQEEQFEFVNVMSDESNSDEEIDSGPEA